MTSTGGSKAARRSSTQEKSAETIVNVDNNRGNAYAKKDDLERAIADYTQAIAINPKNYNPYNNRGITYARKYDLDRAIADYDKAIGLNPKRAMTYLVRGFAYAKKGDKDKAIADFRRTLEMNPSDEMAKMELAKANEIQLKTAPRPDDRHNCELGSFESEVAA